MDITCLAVLNLIRRGEMDRAERLVQSKLGPNVTMLQVASDAGSEDVVKLLIEKGSDVNDDPDNRGTPLRIAILNGRTAVVKVLLENGAVIENRSLHDAFDRRAVSIVKLLLEFGADPNIVNRNGDSLLFRACSDGRNDIVDMLLAKNVILDKGNKLNQIPLEIAIRFGHAKVVSALLKHGAKLNCPCTILHAAASESTGDVANIIIQHECDNYSEDFTVFTELWDDSEFAKNMLKQHSIINEVNRNTEHPPLLTAIVCGNHSVVSALLAKGASIDVNSEEVLKILSKVVGTQYTFQMQPIMMYIIKMLAANMRVNDSVIGVFHTNTSAEEYFESLRTEYYEEFVREVNRLKDEIAFDSLTYYKVLKMDTDDLASHVKNPKLIRIVKNKSYNKFLYYNIFFEQKFQETVVRRALLDTAHETISNIFRMLPSNTIRRLLHFVSDNDLRGYRENGMN